MCVDRATTATECAHSSSLHQSHGDCMIVCFASLLSSAGRPVAGRRRGAGDEAAHDRHSETGGCRQGDCGRMEAAPDRRGGSSCGSKAAAAAAGTADRCHDSNGQVKRRTNASIAIVPRQLFQIAHFTANHCSITFRLVLGLKLAQLQKRFCNAHQIDSKTNGEKD